MNEIKKKISNFPKSPGVYQFVGESGDILYVGKAKNLSNRIKSYFLKEIGRGPGIDLMVQLAADITFIETESEIEAVLLEAELIKKIKPKYNIRLRDDKSFLVVKITKPKKPVAENNYYEQFSCVELVRFKNVDLSDKSAWYFGPYPSGELLKKSLHYLRKIFPYRDCSKTKFNTYRRKGRPCIYGDIRVCTGPCVNWVNKAQYDKNILYLKNFLRNNKQEIYKQLEKDMKKMSSEKRFEEAALIRNRLNALDHLKDIALGIRDDVFNGAASLFHRVECYDISNISGVYGVGAMVVFEDGKKNGDEYRKFKIRLTDSPNDLGMMKEMLLRRFNNDWQKPDLVVIDGGEIHLKVATTVLKQFDLNIPVVSIAKGSERKKNEFHFSDTNLAKYFHGNIQLENLAISARDESHRFAISYYRELHKKGMFK
jgi:excinuclease ABC subunit C